jgi:ABC-type branched-subunit amino acid transport system substrate-binding protein
MQRTLERTLAALAASLLVLAGCGNRLPHRQTVLGGGDATGIDAGGGGAQTGAGAAQNGGSQTGVSGGAPRTYGPSGCVGVNTGAPGVTAITITVGTIVARSGPLPGQFYQMTQAVSSYFGMVNDAGGVCGRKLRLIVQDDGLNADKHLQAAKKLVEDDKVFAIVGMLSAVDKSSAGYLCDKGVPDVGGFALSYNRAIGTDCPKGKPPVYWSPMGGLSPSLIGDGQYYQIVKTENLDHGAVLYHSTLDISKDQGLAHQWALNHAYCRLRQHPSDQAACDVTVDRQAKTFVPDSQTYDVNPVVPGSSYDPLVQRMISAGVDSLWSSMEINSNIKLLQAINRNRALWRQKIGRDPAVYFQLSAYDPKLITEAKSLALNSYVLVPHLPFTEPQHPEMARYLSMLARYQPGAQPSSFGAQGWAGAKLFVDALSRAGANLTRAALSQALDSFTSYTANGLVGPLTPRERVIFNCWVTLQVRTRDGREDFWRWFPQSGFFCNKLYTWR